MGTKFEFNHVLKINELEEKIRREVYSTKDNKEIIGVKKEGARIYPEEPIIAVDKNWNAFGVVKRYGKMEKNSKDTYAFELIRNLNPQERETFTNFYKEFYQENN